MTNLEIPPCGPERDRLVAEAVGWEFFTLGGKSWCSIGVTGRAMLPSQSDADALAALKAWKEQEIGRHVTVDIGHCVHVCLYEPDRFSAFGQAPTLAGAATAALVRWRNERSQS